jgi:uncharacterized protein YqjF (DUF2071 family)
MAKPFLTASWTNLIMANYAVDSKVLKPYLPPYTELDEWNGTHYVSLVGFLFHDTRVRGMAFPFHRDFEEVNLRFYVRYRGKDGWKRGVVFIREIVPRRMISFVANTLYGERYFTLPMRHEWSINPEGLRVAYEWKVRGSWNRLAVLAEKVAHPLKENSETAFITEHYWGYTTLRNSGTGEYEVQHPSWNIHAVKKHDIHCDAQTLYGPALADALSQPPRSVFLAAGSPVRVMPGSKIAGKGGIYG